MRRIPWAVLATLLGIVLYVLAVVSVWTCWRR